MWEKFAGGRRESYVYKEPQVKAKTTPAKISGRFTAFSHQSLIVSIGGPDVSNNGLPSIGVCVFVFVWRQASFFFFFPDCHSVITLPRPQPADHVCVYLVYRSRWGSSSSMKGRRSVCAVESDQRPPPSSPTRTQVASAPSHA